MTRCSIYTVALLAAFAGVGTAFRHNLKNVMEHVTASVFEAAPPDVDGMMTEADTVIDAKIAAATAKYAAAQKTLMNLTMAVAGTNNTNKGMSAHEAVDAMMKANIEKAEAILAKEKVHLMVEACDTLFQAVQSFKTISEPRAALAVESSGKHMQEKIEELKQATIATEQLDLDRLLKLVAQIRISQKRVEDLDTKVKSGASTGIVGATELVYGYAAQLLERQKITVASCTADEPCTAAEAAAFLATLAAMAPLQPEDAQQRIPPLSVASLDKANKKIDAILAKQAKLLTDGQAGLMKLFGSIKSENATAMHVIIDEMRDVNIAKAVAMDLKSALEAAIQEIKDFFLAFAEYKAKDDYKKKISGEADDIIAKADEIKKATEANMLLEVGSFFHLYQMMWKLAIQAKDHIPDDDEDFVKLDKDVYDTAVAVHVWLNGETVSVCEYHTTCKAARDTLIAELEKKANWCDERFTSYFCGNGQEKDRAKGDAPDGGSQPNGKMCQWIEPQPDKGLTGECKQINSPTSVPPPRGASDTIKFAKDHADGAGIFY